MSATLGELLGLLGSGDRTLAELLPIDRRLIALAADKAINLAGAGKVAEGERILAAICAYDSSQPIFWLLLGGVRQRGGDAHAAIAAYDQGLEVSGVDPELAQELRLARGRALLAVGVVEFGRADLEEAARGPDARRSQVAKATLGRR